MRVLVACEESQVVCKAFRERGHEAYSCDIIDCSGGHLEWHIKGDALDVLNPKPLPFGDVGITFKTMDDKCHLIYGKWDLIIAHPPCTYLCNTGTPFLDVSKWGEKAIERAKLREEAFEFFMEFVKADCDRIVIENPVGLPNSRYRKPDQIINPWQFNHPYDKRTCLWLKGVEKLEPFCKVKPNGIKSDAYHTMIDENGKTISWNCELSKRLRSRTFEGIAKAMAEQWG